MLKYFVFLISFLFLLAFVFLFYWQWTANDIELLLQGEEPFAVRLALQDDTKNDRLEFLAQVVFIPNHKQIVLYCVNTDAYNEKERINTMNPASADQFGLYTGNRSINYIHLNRSNGARLFDILEGLVFFLRERIFLQKAEYQYPQGIQYFSGEQILEYMFHRAYHTDPRKEDEDNERLFRQESMLLNLYWNRSKIAEKLKQEQLIPLIISFISTNLTDEEIKSLFAYLLQEDTNMSVLEVPLKMTELKNRPILQVKRKRAQEFFENSLERAKIAWAKPNDDYSVQILNGTEVQGLARTLKFSLQNLGLSILNVDNYKPKPLERTMLFNHSGGTRTTHQFVKLVNIPPDRVSYYRQASDLKLSFAIGTDFNLKKLKLR